jgi:methylenetetrahydrofolate reductase (NADPH)
MTTATSKFSRTLASGRLALTAECLPLGSFAPDALKKLSDELPSGLDAVVVPDNPDEIRGSSLACAALLAAEGRESVLSLATRDRNRIALESDALGAAALGIRAILCLSGNHQSSGGSPQAAGAYDIDSIQLTQAVKNMTRDGVGLNGRRLDSRPDLTLGAIAHPYLRPLDLNMLRLRKKISSGVDFLLTEAVFDLSGFTLWMDLVRAAGMDKQVAIIASVLPVAGVERARGLQKRRTYGPIPEEVIARLEKASDPVREGVSMAAEMAAGLKSVPGVRGIHILSGGCESLAAKVIKEAGLP